MDITKLPDAWRGYNYVEEPPVCGDCAIELAEQLEKALPTWMHINDREPEAGQTFLYVMEFEGSMPLVSIWRGVRKYPFSWRPLIDLDYPPEQS